MCEKCALRSGRGQDRRRNVRLPESSPNLSSSDNQANRLLRGSGLNRIVNRIVALDPWLARAPAQARSAITARGGEKG